MAEITELLEYRAAGYELSDEEVAAVVMPASQEERKDVLVSGSTAVVNVYGTLFQRANLMTRYSGGTSTEQLQSTLTRLANDPNIDRIILNIDSPGGTAIGNEEVVQKIRDIRSQKQVVASINGLAASAGYYIASAAERVYASPSSMVGSIGTLLIHRESSKADEDSGVTFTVLRSGQYKADGNEREPLSQQSRATLEERVVVYHDQFVNAVAESRDVTEAVVRTQFGDGKVFIASEALRRNMIDEIATLEQLLNRSGSASSSTITSKENDMDSRLKAALFARGIIRSMDSSDEVCEAACNAWFAARNITRPEDAAECLAALNNNYTVLESVLEETPVTSSQPVESADEIRSAERYRIEEIRAVAASIGNVPDNLVEAAIENGTAVAQFSHEAVRARTNVDPVSVPISPGEAQADRFNACAVAALESRLGMEPSQQDTAGLESRRLIDFCQQAITAYGDRIPRSATEEEIAGHFLAMGENTPWAASGGSNDPAYLGSASFPNVLSVLANKIIDRAMQMSPTTYSTWTNRLPDIRDFKPTTIVAIGEFNRLPKHDLGRPFEQSKMEEAVSWIKIDEYGDEFVMTPDMLVNDDLDAFSQAMRTKGFAHEMTLNKLCLDHLLSNPRVADGNSMFTAGHNNQILSGSGGVPNSTQFDAMRQLHRKQKGISGQEYLRYDASVVLAGPVHETQLDQTLRRDIFPASETNVNVFRGRYTPVIEPLLQDASNVNQWYTIADPMLIRGIVHAFQTGYGQGGRRRSYFRDETNCRHFQMQGRFATAAVNHQAICFNYGS